MNPMVTKSPEAAKTGGSRITRNRKLRRNKKRSRSIIKTNANDKIPQEIRCLRVALLKSIINIVRHLSKIFGKHMCPVSPTLFATKPGSSPQLKLWGLSTGVTPSYKKEKYNSLCFLRFLHNNFSEIADAAMTLDPTFAQWNPCVEMQKLYTDSRGGLNGPRSCS